MSYFAAAVAFRDGNWTSAELDLDDATDLEAVADLLRDVDPDAGTSLLFVDADDEFLVILRLDDGDDLRAFGSDVAYAEGSKVGEVLIGSLEEIALPESEDESEAVGTPVGDADLLTDRGISASDLLALCAHEGLLPADVALEVSRKVGCADALAELRGE